MNLIIKHEGSITMISMYCNFIF